MKSIFIRIYGGMLGVLVLVAVLGVLSLHLVNEVRAGQHRERLAQGTFSLMADNLAQQNEVERKRSLLMWERLLGVPLDVQPLSVFSLDGGQRARLYRDLVVVEKTITPPGCCAASAARMRCWWPRSSRSASSWPAPPFTCWPTSWCATR